MNVVQACRFDATGSGDLTWLQWIDAPVLVTASDGHTVRAATGDAACLLGVAPAGLSLAQVVGASAARQLAPLLAGTGSAGALALPCVTTLGDVTITFKVKPLPDSDGGGAVLTLDVSDAMAAAQLQALNWARTLEAVADGLPIGIAVFDAQFYELFANDLARQLIGFDPSPARRHADHWWAALFPDPVERAVPMAHWRENVEAARVTPGGFFRQEGEVTCRDGRRRVLQFRYRFVGDVYTAVFWDVTERRHMELELQRLATTDQLTGLLNRRGFTERAQAMLATAQSDAQAALLMLDVDHFKKINDLYGHPVGDRVLEEFARRCRQHLRPQDAVARLGGEEFAVLLPGTAPEAAYEVAQRLLKAIAGTPMQLGAISLTVKASIGLAGMVADGAALDDVMERADRALYAAKASGRNRVVTLPGAF